MKTSIIFRITGIALFIQLALGGLLTFGFVDPLAHIVWGAVVGILALVTLAFVIRLKPRPRPLTGLSVGLVLLLVLQVVLGFYTLDTGDQAVAWVHFINSLAIYGMGVAGTFMALGIDKMVPPGSSPPERGEADRSGPAH
ncbi:MAG: hypothetical protein JRM80_07730 [Nitrososphaerota archaeon]|nr:hypothetical protein [Nitrososphaerota archaeon]